MRLNHPQANPSQWENCSGETGPWCRKGWGPLLAPGNLDAGSGLRPRILAVAERMAVMQRWFSYKFWSCYPQVLKG